MDQDIIKGDWIRECGGWCWGVPFGFANCVEMVGKNRIYSKELEGKAIEFMPNVS